MWRAALVLAAVVSTTAASSCSEPQGPSGNSATPQIAWRSSINGGNINLAWDGVPAIGDGKLYIADGPNITALRTEDGAKVWTTSVHTNVTPETSKILFRGSQLFFPDLPDVISLDASSGQVLWRFTPDSQAVPVESAVDDHAMYTGDWSHKVYALDIHDGHPLWITDVGQTWQYFGSVQGLSLAGDTLYVAVSRFLAKNGYLRSAVIVALDKTTGRELWRFETDGDRHDIEMTPVVAGRNLIGVDVLFSSTFAVDRFTGKEVWRIPGAPGRFGPQDAPTVIADTAFIAPTTNTFMRLTRNRAE
ncbi:MAG: PQQ-binding-like beta-propeller repeat protein [Gemmatimonadota bacterium]|nr:PQQ-binding-like beta-propeller repeat protein [Gemmatimonadota bacterium]